MVETKVVMRTSRFYMVILVRGGEQKRFGWCCLHHPLHRMLCTPCHVQQRNPTISTRPPKYHSTLPFITSLHSKVLNRRTYISQSQNRISPLRLVKNNLPTRLNLEVDFLPISLFFCLTYVKFWLAGGP